MADETRGDLAQTAASLIVTVDALRKVVEQVNERLDKQDKRADRSRLLSKVAMFVLIIMALGGVVQNAVTASRLSSLVNSGFCPMLSVFVGSYDPDSRAPGPGREAYEDAFSTFRKIRVDPLHCPPVIVPPRTDLQTTPTPPG